MKVSSVSSISNHSLQKNAQFKGNFIHKAKRGLLPLALAGGLLMTQPAKATNMDNSHPKTEYSTSLNQDSINFMKNILICAAAVYGIMFLFNSYGSSDKRDDE